MAKKKVEEKLTAKGTLTVENDARGKQYDRREESPVVSPDVEEAVDNLIKKELIEIVEDEVQIYQKGMKGKHIAELFSEEEE